VGEYTDWVSGAHASIPLTRIIKLMLATEYSVRDNRDATLPLRTPEEVAADAARGRESAQILRDAERGEDYRTWMGQVGTSFEVTRSVSFATYVQRFERMSDSDVLTYSRDIFSAMFTYFHQF
jgi:hypothetical protein